MFSWFSVLWSPEQESSLDANCGTDLGLNDACAVTDFVSCNKVFIYLGKHTACVVMLLHAKIGILRVTYVTKMLHLY